MTLQSMSAGEHAGTTPAEHGTLFTAHMVSATWVPETGWQKPSLIPLENLSVHPGMIGLHYGQVIFEGLKAYRQPDGSVAVFRPYENARRFQRSARRLAMPELPEDLFVGAIDTLVSADESWLPDDPSLSLYLRPLMYASEVSLMLRPASEYRFLLMAFVAGGFFGDVVEPVSVWVSREHVRAVQGGTGNVKCAANYAPSFLAQRMAQEKGCHQVVWLDAAERRWVEELGGMNMFFVRRRGDSTQVVTPELSGTLLPGVTRDTILTLAEQLGHEVAQERISLSQWRDECRSGVISESFACGTAAVVTPIGSVVDEDGDWIIGDGTMGPVTRELRSALVGAQCGWEPDPHGWRHTIG